MHEKKKVFFFSYFVILAGNQPNQSVTRLMKWRLFSEDDAQVASKTETCLASVAIREIHI